MKLGILGYPIGHSLSPKIFEILGKELNKDISYDIVNVSPEEFNFGTLKQNYDGLNVTYPYKEKVLDYINSYNMLVSRTKCANTLLLKEGVAYNTDVEGFEESLHYHNIDFKDKKVLICGGGCSARSILQVACHLGAKKVQLKLRDNFKFDSAAKHFLALYPDVELAVFDYTDAFDIVINATTIGLDESNKADGFFADIFKNTKIAYDVNYKPNSPFQQAAQKSNVPKIIDGKMMLIYQALFAYEKWFHKIENKTELAYNIKGKLT